MAYRIEFTDEARAHLAQLAARDRAILVASVRNRLSHEPERETRHRKRLRANALSPWVLRVGQLRVYYGVSRAPESLVTIRAIGIKVRERLFVGGEEIDLS